MKYHPTLAAFLLSFAALSAAEKAVEGVEISREEATSVKSVDPDSLGDKVLELDGKLVRLKFTYRLQNVEKKPDGALEGSVGIWRYSASTKPTKYGLVKVSVPPAGAAWFQRLPTSEASRASIVVIARITNADTSPKAELLGREIKTDLKGARIVW